VDLPTAVNSWSPSAVLSREIQEGSQEGSGWKKGLLIGGGVGLAFGLLAHALVDAMPCDSCSGTGSNSSAEGARLEFAVGFGLLGAALGALIGR
jgi:hypothetical protein